MTSTSHISKALTLVLSFILYTVVVASCATSSVIAGSGLVSSVGGVTFVQGASQFWVSSKTPTISGITTAGAEVTGTVGEHAVTATADDSGNWTWTTPAELTGDNEVAITSGTETVTFTLTVGDLPESIASASGSTLSPAGSNWLTMLVLGFGATTVALGYMGLRAARQKSD